MLEISPIMLTLCFSFPAPIMPKIMRFKANLKWAETQTFLGSMFPTPCLLANIRFLSFITSHSIPSPPNTEYLQTILIQLAILVTLKQNFYNNDTIYTEQSTYRCKGHQLQQYHVSKYSNFLLISPWISLRCFIVLLTFQVSYFLPAYICIS